MRKYAFIALLLLTAPGIALSQQSDDLFNKANLPGCAPVKFEWAKESFPNHFCKTETFSMKHDERRVFNADGEKNAKGFIRSGFAALKCDKGNLILTDSSCSGPKTANEILAAQDSTSRIGQEQVSAPGRVLAPANPVSPTRADVAESINKLNGFNGSFQDSSFRAAQAVQDAVGGLSAGGSGAAGQIASGNEGRVFTTILQGNVAKIILTVRAKFDDVSASVVKYVDHEVCVADSCQVVRTSIDVGFGGGSGHYWGYDQWSEKIHTINIQGKPDDRVIVNVTGSYLLLESDIRIDTLSPTAVQAAAGGNLFTNEVKGKALCGVTVTFTGSRTSNSLCVYGYEYKAVHSSSVSICPKIPENENLQSGFACTRCNPTPRLCTSEADIDRLAGKWFCPPGLTQQIVGNSIICRAGLAAN